MRPVLRELANVEPPRSRRRRLKVSILQIVAVAFRKWTLSGSMKGSCLTSSGACGGHGGNESVGCV
jgi:hypothetical protein